MTSILKNVFNLFLLLMDFALMSQTIEHDVYDALKTEVAIGIDVPTHSFKLLDSIFAEAETQISFPVKPDDSTAFDICKQFSEILEDKFGFEYKLVQTLSVGLENKNLDCNYYSLLFYTLLNKKKSYAVYPIAVPGHIFIRWYKNDSTYFNYETTTKEITEDSTIRSVFKISEQAEKSCLYMCPVSDSKMTALHLAELAVDIADSNMNMAIALNRKAYDIDSLSFHIYKNLSIDYFNDNKPDSSDYFFDKALKLDSLNYTVYQGRGEMYMSTKEFPEAIKWFTKAISINPDDPTLYMYRCYSYLEAKEREPAMADFQLANNKIDKHTILAFFINYPFLAYLDEQLIILFNNEK